MKLNLGWSHGGRTFVDAKLLLVEQVVTASTYVPVLSFPAAAHAERTRQSLRDPRPRQEGSPAS